MTIQLPTKAEQEALEEYLQNPEGAAIFFALAVGSDEYGDLIRDGDWGSAESGGIYLDFTLAQRLEVEDAPSSFAISLNGIAVPQLAGLSSYSNIGGSSTSQGDTVSTEFFAVSARGEANRLALNQLAEWPGVPPDEVLRDAARLAPYSTRYTNIEPLKEPLLYFQRPDAHFWPSDSVGSVFARVEEQTPYRVRDNAWGGLTASVEVEATEVRPYRHYNASDFGSNGQGVWRPPPRTERRYSDVVVYRRNPDGTDAFEPQRAPIEYRGAEFPPLRNASKWVSLDDTTELAAIRAKNLANKMARKFSRAPYQDSGVILPFFDPLIEIQDVFLSSGRWETPKGIFDTQWMCWVESYRHSYLTLTTQVSYSSAIVEKDRLEIPDFAMAGISGGVLKTLLEACEEIGGELWLDVDVLPWVIVEGDDLVFASDAPEVDLDGDDVLITCPATTPAPLWGELTPYELSIDGSVLWAWIEGDEWVIDTAASGGHAVLDGDEVVISQ